MSSRSVPQLETLLQDTAWLRALARGLVGSQDADDLLQDAWVRALEPGAGPMRSARAWMRTVARNLARDRRRGEHNRTGREAKAARPEAQPSSEELTLRVELFEKLARVVRSLEEPYRTTITLRYLEELSVRAIAEREGVPLRTVETRLRRGLQQLRTRLDVLHGGEREAWFGACLLAAGGGAVTRVPSALLLASLLLLAGGASFTAWGLSGAAEPEAPLTVPLLAPVEGAASTTPVADRPARRTVPTALPLRGPVELVVTCSWSPVPDLALGGELAGVVTDAQGRARFPWNPVWEASHTLEIPAGEFTLASSFSLPGPGRHEVELEEREGTLQGYVIDPGAQPVQTTVCAFRTLRPDRVVFGLPGSSSPLLSNEALAGSSFEFLHMAGPKPGLPGEFTLLIANADWVSAFPAVGTVHNGSARTNLLLIAVPARTIRGSVVDPDGVGLADARVEVRYSVELLEALRDESVEEGLLRAMRDELLEMTKRKGIRFLPDVRYEVPADERGAFEVYVPEGVVAELTVRHAAYRAWMGEHGVEDRRVTAVLGRGGEVFGRVVADGEPLRGASVRLWTEDRKEACLSDAEGRFHFVGVRLDEGALVSAYAPGRAPQVVEIHPAAGERVERTVVLEVGGTLAGRVYDAKGRARSEWVYYRSDHALTIPYALRLATPRRRSTAELFTWPFEGRVRAGSDGRFRIEGARGRELLLWTEDEEGNATGALWTALGVPGEVQLRVGLGRDYKASLEVHLVDRDTGDTLDTGEYRLVPVGPGSSGELLRGQAESGSFSEKLRILGREPGSYVLEARQDTAHWTTDVLVLPAGWTTVPIPVERVRTVSR